MIDATIRQGEPVGGAQRDPAGTAINLGKVIAEELDLLCKMDSDAVMKLREERFLQIGG